jgi:hypothetical protein
MRAPVATASVFVGFIAGLAGCDSRATASDPAARAGLAGAGDARSREYETCSASRDCAAELRCFDHACRRAARSTVGDYFAAAGALARTRGDIEGAVASYAQALAHYDAEKVPVPPELDCGYGAALAAGKAKKERAELGARVLHRCVLAAPAGSRLRDQALGELAGLADAGLDPVLLGATKLADLYLTKSAARPAPDKTTIAVTATPPPAGKSYALIPDKLAEPELHAALVACWDAFTAASKKDALAVTLALKVSYVASEYEDEPGSYAIKIDPPIALPAGTPEAAADTCVRQVVEPAIKGLKLADAFATRLAITIK